MKKFLAVFDGYHFSSSTLRFAIQLATEAKAQLVGVFLDEASYRSFNIAQVLTTDKDADTRIRNLEERDQKRRDEAVRQFQAVCGKAAVSYIVHRDRGVAVQELIQETMFADLLIIDKGENFSRKRQKPPTAFVRHLLSALQCPALLVPSGYKKIDHITLLYDGEPSSTYALRQFSYLMGNMNGVNVEMLTVKPTSAAGTRLPHNKLIREWMKKHFPKAIFTVLKGDAELKVVKHLKGRAANDLVVLGAYRRSEVSRWFRASMADILMKELDTPLFIAHNK